MKRVVVRASHRFIPVDCRIQGKEKVCSGQGNGHLWLQLELLQRNDKDI